MATDKALTGARNVESDPNFMLLFFYIRYTKEAITDWDKITQLMGLPTVGATKKRFQRLNQAQEKAMSGLDETKTTPSTTSAIAAAIVPIAHLIADPDTNTKKSKARKAEDASDDGMPAPSVKKQKVVKAKVIKAKNVKSATKGESEDDGGMKEEA